MPVLPDGDERPSKCPGDRELRTDVDIGDRAGPGDPNDDDRPDDDEGDEADEEWVPA